MATGGTISTVGSDTVHTFTSSGSLDKTVYDVQILAIGGGGGGWYGDSGTVPDGSGDDDRLSNLRQEKSR